MDTIDYHPRIAVGDSALIRDYAYALNTAFVSRYSAGRLNSGTEVRITRIDGSYAIVALLGDESWQAPVPLAGLISIRS